MIVYPHIDQNSPEWRQLRRGRPTASRISEIVTPAKATWSASARPYMMELLADCFSTDVDPDREGFSTYWTRRGQYLEPMARLALSEHIGKEIHQVGFCLHDDGVFGCSPDGLIMNGEAYEEGTEIKCPEPRLHVAHVAAGELPKEYAGQIHGSMVITGLHRWHFFSYCPGMQPLHVVVERDSYTERVAECMARFTQEYKELRASLIPKLQLTLPAPEQQAA